MKEYLFKTNDFNLSYVAGPKNGPPLLLIPGQNATWKSYEKVLNQLAQSNQVYAISLNGHGNSSKLKHYNYETLSAVIVQFIEEVIQAPVIISGNAIGGLLALYIAHNHKHWVKALIMENTPILSGEYPRIQKEPMYAYFHHISKHLGQAKPNYLAYFKLAYKPLQTQATGPLPYHLCSLFSRLMRNKRNVVAKGIINCLPLKYRDLLNTLATIDPAFSKAWVSGLFSYGFSHREALEGLTVPTMVLHGNWYHTDAAHLGAMNYDDAFQVKKWVKQLSYVRFTANYHIHHAMPQNFCAYIDTFMEDWFPKHNEQLGKEAAIAWSPALAI